LNQNGQEIGGHRRCGGC